MQLDKRLKNRLLYLENELLLDIDEYQNWYKKLYIILNENNEFEDYDYPDENKKGISFELFENEQMVESTIFDLLVMIYKMLDQNIPIQCHVLKAVRKIEDKTMEEMAIWCSISRQYWQQIEKGERTPSNKIKKILIETYKINPIIFENKDN